MAVSGNDLRVREPLEKLLRDAGLISPDDQTAEHCANAKIAKLPPVPGNEESA